MRAEALRDALLPALLLGAYAIGALLIYLVRGVRHHDHEIANRGSTALIGMGPRHFFAWAMRPLWTGLVRLRFPPDAITILSVLLSMGAGLALAAGQISLGGWLYLFSGACDFVDGRLARESGQASPAGAAMDSVLDRYAESAVLVGLGWLFRDSWVLVLVLLALVGSNMVPYVRARGEGLGVDVKMGTMQRPERMVILGMAAVWSPLGDVLLGRGMHHHLLVGALGVLAVTTQVTALQRLGHVVQALDPSRRRASLGVVGKNVIASVVATALDFGVVLALMRVGVVAWGATAVGCAVGGVINFLVNRWWTFRSQGAPSQEALRYTVVSVSSGLLNTGAVATLMLLPGVSGVVAWAIARVVVFATWNHPLQRDYVFARTP